MDIFQGNTKLEEALFTGMDYALYSRHDIETPFMPFMMLHKDGNRKLMRLGTEGDPSVAFKEILDKDTVTYDQIIMCFEGRVPHDGVKQDAIITMGFDTSHETGLLFLQRFRGIESGKAFEKLGNPALASKDEPLPVKLVPRDTFKLCEEPYISGLIIKDEEEGNIREVIAGHPNASMLSNYLYNLILDIVEDNEVDFFGKIQINLVPGTVQEDGFSQFIFANLTSDLKDNEIVRSWEKEPKKKLRISFNYNKASSN